MRKIIPKKVPLSKEEKRQRVEDYNLFENDQIDVDEFIKREIYDEYVEITCLKCGHKDEIEYDILLELFEYEDYDIPELECPFCHGGTAMPTQFIEEYRQKQSKK